MHYKNIPVIGSPAEVYRYSLMPVCQICHFRTSPIGCSNVASVRISNRDTLTHTCSLLLTLLDSNTIALNKGFLSCLPFHFYLISQMFFIPLIVSLSSHFCQILRKGFLDCHSAPEVINELRPAWNASYSLWEHFSKTLGFPSSYLSTFKTNTYFETSSLALH